jgi:RNA polymerase sigma factor (TIGR02999 family)
MTTEDTTILLDRWRRGDAQAGGRLAELLYAELQKLAHNWFSREQPGHTLQTTALVNELYLRLFSRDAPDLSDKAHLLAIASQQLRRILIDHARQACAAKRGDQALRVTLSADEMASPSRQQELVEVDDLLTQLERLDERAFKVVELRFFGGLSEKEIAEALSISVATVKRDWQFARAWLGKMLKAPTERVRPGQSQPR